MAFSGSGPRLTIDELAALGEELRLAKVLAAGNVVTATFDCRGAGTRRRGVAVFELDSHHAIERGRQFLICGNSWKMLADTRFAEHFEFFGDFSRHYGVFPDCGIAVPFGAGEGSAPDTPAACC